MKCIPFFSLASDDLAAVTGIDEGRVLGKWSLNPMTASLWLFNVHCPCSSSVFVEHFIGIVSQVAYVVLRIGGYHHLSRRFLG